MVINQIGHSSRSSSIHKSKTKKSFLFQNHRQRDRKTDIQKRQKGRNDRQAEKTDKQKRQTGRNDIKTQQTLTENTEGQKRKTQRD